MDTSDIKRLIRQCEGMKYGLARLHAALELLPLADKNGDPWCRITARYLVSWGYLMTDDIAKALPYCAEFFQLLEQYPHIKLGAIFELSLARESVTVALCLPQISREQCKAFLDQLELRCKHYNMGKYAFHTASFNYYFEMGMLEQARRSFEQFRVAEMEADWDCEACKVGSIASALLSLGQRDEALRAAQPLLTGALKCEHGREPSGILVNLLESDLEHGDMEAAGAKAARLARMGFVDRSDLSALSTYLLYLAAVDPERSLRLLEKGIAWSVGLWDIEDLFGIYRSAWAVCAVLAKCHTHLILKLPRKLAIYQEDGNYQAQALSEWFYKKAAECGEKFDQRNGLDRYWQSLCWVEKMICQP